MNISTSAMTGHYASMQREFEMKFGKLVEPLDIQRYRETELQRINLLKPGLK